jgi:sulfonate transport system permease protein
VRRILVPATLPAYITGLRSGLGLGWMFVVAAEIMGASQGLGFLLIDGEQTGRPATIIAAILLFAVLGKLTDVALAQFGRRALAWQDSFGNSAGHARNQLPVETV